MRRWLSDLPGFLHLRAASLRRLVASEPVLLSAAFLVVCCTYGFIELADAVKEGHTQTVDEWVLRSLRRPEDPAVPIGPPWLREVGLDVTALGSVVVLLLMLLAVIGYLCLYRRFGMALATALTTLAGSVVSFLLKHAMNRDRPTVVPHLREVTSSSFPSGHAMQSAIVYLTLGILLAQVVKRRAAKLYLLFWAMLLTLLVGVSRIYLGVHYPTDVLAGWMAGIAWALGCWVVLRCVRWKCPPSPDAASAIDHQTAKVHGPTPEGSEPVARG